MDKPYQKVIINELGKRYYNNNGDLHREDGPAIINSDGGFSYWLNGDGIDSYKDKLYDKTGGGQVRWFVFDEYVSIGRPAIDEANGHKEWMSNGIVIWPEL